MDVLSNLIANPLDAVISTITGEQTAAAAPLDPPGNATFSEDVIRMLIYNLFQGDSRLQQQVLTDYYSPDVAFSLNGDFLRLSGRDELQQLLRGSQLLASYKPEVLEISSNEDKAVILLNLNLSYKLLPLTWWAPLHIVTTITLNFGPNPNPLAAAADYADLITGHHQEMSVVDLLWWNPAWDWFYRRVWSKISGKTLAAIYHVEEPVLTKVSSYIDEGAGYLQALLWTLEDIARASGFQGLPSAAVTLNLIPSRKPSTPPPPAAEAAAAPPRPAAAAAVDTGLTEAPQTPTQQTAVGRAALPVSADAAAAEPTAEPTAEATAYMAPPPAAGAAAGPPTTALTAAAAAPLQEWGELGTVREPAAAAETAAVAAQKATEEPSAKTAAAADAPTTRKAAAPARNPPAAAAQPATTQAAATTAPVTPPPAVTPVEEPPTLPETVVSSTTEVPVSTTAPETAAAAAEQPSAAASAAAAGTATEDVRDTSRTVEGRPGDGAGSAPPPAARAEKATGKPAATAADVAKVAADVRQVLRQAGRQAAVAEEATGSSAGTEQASSSTTGPGVARDAAAAVVAGLKVEGAGRETQQQQKPELKKQASKGSKKHKRGGSKK